MYRALQTLPISDEVNLYHEIPSQQQGQLIPNQNEIVGALTDLSCH